MRRLFAYPLLIGIIFTFVTIALGQTSKLDSLKRRSLHVTGTEFIDCINTISGSYYPINTDSAFFYAMKAETLSREMGYWQGASNALRHMGDILRERRRPAEGEQYFRKALLVSGRHPHSDNWAMDNLLLGDVLRLQGRYPEAIELINKSLQYFIASAHDSMTNFCYRELGTLYTETGYYEKAFSYFQKAIPNASKVSDPVGSLGSPYMWVTYLLGSLYKDAGDFNTALRFYTSSMNRAMKNKSPSDYYRILSEMTAMKGRYDSAIYYYHRYAEAMRERIPDSNIIKTGLYEPFINLGEIYLVQHQYDSALHYFSVLNSIDGHSSFVAWDMRLKKDMAKTYLATGNLIKTKYYAARLLDRAIETGTRQYTRDAYEILWQFFDQQKNADSAYFYYLKFIAARDEIARDIQLRNIAIKEMETAQQRQQAQINILQNQKTIQSQRVRFLLYVSIAIVAIGGVVLWNISLKKKNAVHQSRALENSLKLQVLENKNIQVEYENKKTLLEMQALRAQMNPHFIFNSLNAINRFILENDRMQASAYLASFSRLIRLILHHSQENMVALENEIEALKIYLELEALRFDNYFNYQIRVDPLLDITTLQVPPLIMQPYVENAIWHGLMHKREPGSLLIDISREEGTLVCRIVDDGIGRQRAAAIKSKSGTTHKSMGMRITKDRINRIMQEHSIRNPVQVKDIVLPGGSPGGTEVIIKFPLMYA